eukprot:4843088-Prorocentrum_lima.AAC.1
MTSSLVGSEMCIRDRRCPAELRKFLKSHKHQQAVAGAEAGARTAVGAANCLLYTSDAADDM